MWNEQQFRFMEENGYKIQLKPNNYNNKRTKYLVTYPDGQTLETYDNWVDLDYDYQQGLLPEGAEGAVMIDNPDEWSSGPGNTCDAIWEYIYTAGATPGLLANWLIGLAIIVALFLVSFIVWRVEAILHPCKPEEILLPGNKKQITNPDCAKWILDLETGEVTPITPGVNDWLFWIVIAAVGVAGLYFLAQSGLFKGRGEDLEGALIKALKD